MGGALVIGRGLPGMAAALELVSGEPVARPAEDDEVPPDPLVAEQILTYHLPEAASSYYPLQTSAAWQLSPVARRESILSEWGPTAVSAGSASTSGGEGAR